MAITQEESLSFAETLRRARQRSGMSQRALARALRLSPSVICLWENGRRVPSVETLVSVAKALRISAHELIPGGGLPPEKYHCEWCDVSLEKTGEGDYTCPQCHVTFEAAKVHGALYDELRKSFGVLGQHVTPDRLARLVDTAYVGNEVKVKYTEPAEKHKKLCALLQGTLSEMDMQNAPGLAQLLARMALTLERSNVPQDEWRIESLVRYVERALRD